MLINKTRLTVAALSAVLAGGAVAAPPDVVQSDAGSDTAMGPYVLSGLSSGYQNTGAGYLAFANITSGYKNSAFGYIALAASQIGYNNAAFGANALHTTSGTGSDNSAFGSDALASLGSYSYSTAVGSQAALGSTSGVSNVAVGADSMYTNVSGSSNTVVGYSALYYSKTGSADVAVGDSAMMMLEGSSNTAVGFNALFGKYGATGNYNVALGSYALESTSSNGNTGVGYGALTANTTGVNNISLGSLAGSAPTTTSSNIEIGNHGDGPDTLLVKGSIPLDSQLTRLGSTQTKTFIAGVYGTSVRGNAVYVNSFGQLGVVVSSERFKTSIATMANADALSKLRPVTFQLKSDPQGPMQYGLIAEEVARVYPAIVIRNERGRIDGVRYDELTPILLRRIQQQEAQIHHWLTELNEMSALRAQILAARASIIERQRSVQLAATAR